MTGFGEAHRQENGVAVAVEVRTINSRYFKLTLKCGEGYGALEGEIESVVRQQIRRGTVQMNLRVDRGASADDYRVNASVLGSYLRQIEALSLPPTLREPIGLHTLLTLPGVIDERASSTHDCMEIWPLIQQTLVAALDNLAKMRSDEGRAMTADLKANCATVAAELAHIEFRAPLVVDAYRARMQDRIKKVLDEYQLSLEPGDLIKEISIYSERSDISEEIVRLRSHLEQFDTITALPESTGRKLEFLTQEMFRETNTIGSKSNDVQIARHVIEIKAAIERIREMIQNVE